ncbi:MAG TPA: hypothetical protein VGG19_18785 [Tepidisphaeraceae bacterium]|jgi:hypothetical protein
MRYRYGFFIALFLFAFTSRGAVHIDNDLHWSVELSPSKGDYQIKTAHPKWSLGGSLNCSLSNVATQAGQDRIGEYQQLNFSFEDTGSRTASIRLYRNQPIVIFSEAFPQGSDHHPHAFPVLSKLPGILFGFRFSDDVHMQPISFDLASKSSDEQYGGPFCLFDRDDNALLFSPASHFMIAMLDGDQKQGISSGINRTVEKIPSGFTQQTILVAQQGINRTWNTWGHALTDLYSKKRPGNDADVSLKYLSYWTDNGAAYYYNYDLSKGYANTLLAVKQHLDQIGVAIHSFQLDSWWYPKTFDSVEKKSSNKPHAKDPRLPAGTWNRYGGLITYTPDPDLFPQGLKPFQQQLNLPFITHNRWIDATSPYHKDYKISGIVSVDPKWWDKIIGDISSWGVQVYEQDWNNYIYKLSPELYSTTWAGDAYMDNMAHACAEHGLTMQYCMILPRNLMQGGAEYSNLTSVRLSDDRFGRSRWRQFLFGSQMASALGVWPWVDVFRSHETANMLICDLSAGVVGLADAIGHEDLGNIARVARKDGVICKPDEPLIPIDQTFINQAQANSQPIICATHSGPTQYVFSFQGKEGSGSTTAEFSPSDLGMTGNVFIYDYFAGQGKLSKAGKQFFQPLNDEGWAYDIICPVGASHMALVGDIDIFATCGKQRIASVTQNTKKLEVELCLTAGETEATLAVYAPSKPEVSVDMGQASVDYDAKTGLAKARIFYDVASALPPAGVFKLHVTWTLSAAK